MLQQYVYASHAKVTFNDTDLTNLLRKSRENNMRLGVSGMLVYQDGLFLQVIEGSEPLLSSLFARISKDLRHEILSVNQSPIELRSFETWSMGFFHADRDAIAHLPGHEAFFAAEGSLKAYALEGHRARQLLLQFRNSRWRHLVSAA